MQVAFIEAKYMGKIELDQKILKKLPDKIGLVATVQFVNALEDAQRILENNHKLCYVSLGKQKHKGQVLGCDISSAVAIKDKVDAYLYIGTGDFHPIMVSFETGKKVFCYNPISKSFYEVRFDSEKLTQKKKGSLLKFLAAENIGILVSTKLGQQKFKEAYELKKKLVSQGKHAYILVSETLDFNEMENFNFVDCFVNTMCPRIGFDDRSKFTKPIINYKDISEQVF